MSPQTAKVLVLGSTGAMFALVLLDSSSTDSRIRRLWPLAVVSVGLALVADVAPEIAGPFAVLVLLAVAARQKGVLGGVIGKPVPSTASTPSK
jgi:hypothetical protein